MYDATPETIKVRRTLAYRRVSGPEQGKRGVSLEEQDTAIRRYCQDNGLPEPIDFADVISGSEEYEASRHQVRHMLANVRRGDLVIVNDIDRFGRDMVFIVRYVRALIRMGAAFVALNQRFDSRSPAAEDTLGHWAFAADAERRRIRRRTVGARRFLREQGYFVEGLPPFGYVRIPKGRNSNKPNALAVDPAKAPIVQRAFTLAANGQGVANISKVLRSENPGVAPFGPAWILFALRNRIYTGKVSKTPVRPRQGRKAAQLPTEWIAAHEPIISEELFAQVQVALKNRTHGRKAQDDSGTVDYLFRGVGRCAECGAMVSAIARNSSGRHKVGYYICRGHIYYGDNGKRCPTSRYLRQPEADAEVGQQFLTFCRTLLKSLSRPPREQKRPDFDADRERVRAGKARILELVRKGLMTVDDVAKAINDIDDELAAIDSNEAAFRETCGNDTAESRRGARGYCQQVIDEWPSLTVDVKRAIVKAFVRDMLIGRDQSIRITWRDPSEIASAYADDKFPALRAPAELPALPPAEPSMLRALLDESLVSTNPLIGVHAKARRGRRSA